MEPSPHPTRITVRSGLTLRNAFLFPIQHPAARRDVLWGALLLFIPVVGWMLNMGHRLRLVHRMHRQEEPWPAWGNYPELLKHGLVTTLAIAAYHLPAVLVGSAAYGLDLPLLFGPAVVLWLAGTYCLPGFMTFYAKDYDLREILIPTRAIRRAFQGGRPYLHAWAIGIAAVLVSFLGLLAFGIGFAITSVWFWQVAAFCFATVFTRQYRLDEIASAPGRGTDAAAFAQPLP